MILNGDRARSSRISAPALKTRGELVRAMAWISGLERRLLRYSFRLWIRASERTLRAEGTSRVTSATCGRGESDNKVSIRWCGSSTSRCLNACIKGDKRIHPLFKLPLERVVPSERPVICGKEFKAGTVIEIHA